MKFFIGIILLIILAFFANLFLGQVAIPFSTVIKILCGEDGVNTAYEYIVLQSRLPSAIAAVIAGAALSVAGLLMQTAFRNSLAGPSIMGINSGASLGVALVIMVTGGTVSMAGIHMSGEIAIIGAALVGSLSIMGILIALSLILKNDLMLLIAGVLIGYLVSSLIMIINFGSSADGIQSYVMWGMGSFQNVPLSRILPFAIMTFVGLLIAFLLMKPLDSLLLGDDYAINLGVNVKRVKQLLLFSTGILAAATTAYCGPIAFIGLAVPHIARILIKTDLHRRLLPTTLCLGVIIALLCNILCILPCSSLFSIGTASNLPLNAVTPLFGVPVILYVILKRK